MRILLINQFFWPDTAATGQLLTDVARLINHKAHTVTVLCARARYGATDNAVFPPPVEIVRLGGTAFSRGTIGRMASYLSFFACATVEGVVGSKHELVLTMTTPPLISLVGTILKILRGSHHFIWEMDLYPDIAVDLEVLKPRSATTKLIGRIANFSRKRADGIIALGEDMKGRLVASGIAEDKILVAENWADGDEIRPAPFSDGPFVVHYSGTFGLAHEEYTITEVMRCLRDDKRFRFVFVGGGARRKHLEKFCQTEHIVTAEFRSYASRSEMNCSLAEGHIGLVTQIPETLGSIVPSKTYGIMAAGRPVLYIGPVGATPSMVVESHACGWRIEPGDVSGMVKLLEWLEQDRGLVRVAGARAREAFERCYDRSIGVSRILSILGLSTSSKSNHVSAFAS